MLISELKRCGGEAAFLKLYFGMKDKIIDDIKASEPYERFSKDELTQFKIPENEVGGYHKEASSLIPTDPSSFCKATTSICI